MIEKEFNNLLLKEIANIEKNVDTSDVIEEVPEKPIEEIIREVAEEENMTEEEVLSALRKLKYSIKPSRATKPKVRKDKNKAKKKIAKQSRKRNRK